jgi:inorganic pyrophosphatase
MFPNELEGDGDPLDICVISERPITKAEIVLNARVVGGLRMVDHGEADDKIVAVLSNDLFWSNVNDISELPQVLVERLRHYFSTYKLVPGQENQTYIESVYDSMKAQEIIQCAMQDYEQMFG